MRNHSIARLVVCSLLACLLPARASLALRATDVRAASATLNGLVSPNNRPTLAWFEWGTGSTYGQTTAPVDVGNGSADVPLTATLTGLIAGAPYHYRVVTSNSFGILPSRDIRFWSPVVHLQGPGHMIVFKGEPFVDPGVFVSGSVIDLAGGYSHSTALGEDGSLFEWGYRFTGTNHWLTNAPLPKLTNAVAITGTATSSYVLKSDGTVSILGDFTVSDNYLRLLAYTNVNRIDADNGTLTVVRADHTAEAWPNNNLAQTNNVQIAGLGSTFPSSLSSVITTDGRVVAPDVVVPDDATNLVAIVNAFVSFVLRDDGHVFVLGKDIFGGTDPFHQFEVPSSATNITAIANASRLNMALRNDGTLLTWGDDSNGLLALPTAATNLVALHTGSAHVLALRADGAVIAWGPSDSINLPSGSRDTGAAVVPRSVVARGVTVEGLPDTAVPGIYTISYSATNAFGEPSANVAKRTVEVVVPVYPAVTNFVPTGVSNSVATLRGFVDPRGEPANVWFEWGPGDIYPYHSPPVSMAGAGSITVQIDDLVPGSAYHCRLVASNRFGIVRRSWDQRFQSPRIQLRGADPLVLAAGSPLVDPGATVRMNPIKMGRGLSVRWAVKADTTAEEWGATMLFGNELAGISNIVAVEGGGGPGPEFLFLGTDGVLNKVLPPGPQPTTPRQMRPLASNVVAFSQRLALMESHQIELRKSGTGDYVDVLETNTPPAATNIVAITSKSFWSAAVRDDGRVFVWGDARYGLTNLPPEAVDLVDVSAGSSHIIALKSDGTVVAWGDYTFGGNYGQSTVPRSATNVVRISAGDSYSMALRADGSVLVWGRSDQGHLEVPQGLTNVVAILAADRCMAMTATGKIVEWGGPSYTLVPTPTGLDEIGLDITVAGDVDASQPGDYTLTYTTVAPSGAVGAATRRVTVVPAGTDLRPRFGASLARADGSFQFNFTNQTGTSFTTLASTNAALPLDQWTVIGTGEQLSPGVFRVIDLGATNLSQRFYLLKSQ
jgi:alpha-tubulin suppressor-like RCC1 family protein